MNSDPSKLRQKQQAQESTELQGRQESVAPRQFDSVEELIRFDANQTPVPGTVTDRLQESISLEPKPDLPWWKRLLKRL